jgi:hypothetical protein
MDPMTEEQINYRSFMIRMWQVKDDDQPTWRASIEVVDSGEQYGFTSLDEMFAFLEEQTRAWENNQETIGG